MNCYVVMCYYRPTTEQSFNQARLHALMCSYWNSGPRTIHVGKDAEIKAQNECNKLNEEPHFKDYRFEVVETTLEVHADDATDVAYGIGGLPC